MDFVQTHYYISKPEMNSVFAMLFPDIIQQQHPPPPPPPIEKIVTQQPSQAVVVQAYTESLCIDCKNFIEKQLIPTYNDLGGDEIIDLHIYPFGNADIVDDGGDDDEQKVNCQHGDGECDANSWEQCAVDKYQAKDYIEFIGCLEESLPMGRRSVPFDEDYFHACSDLSTSAIEFDYLKSCHDNPMQSWMLQQKYAKLTPEHDHVPWVLIDGRKFDEESQNLETEICKSYVEKGGSDTKCSEILKEK